MCQFSRILEVRFLKRSGVSRNNYEIQLKRFFISISMPSLQLRKPYDKVLRYLTLKLNPDLPYSLKDMAVN